MERKAQAVSHENKQRIYDFLKTHPIGVLATVDPNHNPHAAVVYFSVDANFEMTFMSKHNTKKHDNLMHNNHVMLIAYEPVSQTTVQIVGEAEEISDNANSQAVFQRMLKIAQTTSESGMPPISKLYAGHYTAYRIRPKQIRMAVFARPNSGSSDTFETIDFIGD